MPWGMTAMKTTKSSQLPVLMPFGLAQGAPSSNVAWTVGDPQPGQKGDASIGAKIETVETEDVNACTDCHGKGGAEPDRTSTRPWPDRWPPTPSSSCATTRTAAVKTAHERGRSSA